MLNIAKALMATAAGKVFIIAEIGINHNGQVDICKELIDDQEADW